MDKIELLKGSCMGNIQTCYQRYGNSLAELALEAQKTHEKIGNVQVDTSVAVQKGSQEMCVLQINQCNALIGNDAVQQYIDDVMDYTAEKYCRKFVNDCFMTFGGGDMPYAQLMNSKKGGGSQITYAVGHGKQAVLQGAYHAGQVLSSGKIVPSNIKYAEKNEDSICWTILNEDVNCAKIAPRVFGEHMFPAPSQNLMSKEASNALEQSVNNTATAGESGVIFKNIMNSLGNSCTSFGGVYKPLWTPYLTQDNLELINNLNYVMDYYGGLKFIYMLTYEELDSNTIDISKEPLKQSVQAVNCTDANGNYRTELCGTISYICGETYGGLLDGNYCNITIENADKTTYTYSLPCSSNTPMKYGDENDDKDVMCNNVSATEVFKSQGGSMPFKTDDCEVCPIDNTNCKKHPLCPVAAYVQTSECSSQFNYIADENGKSKVAMCNIEAFKPFKKEGLTQQVVNDIIANNMPVSCQTEIGQYLIESGYEVPGLQLSSDTPIVTYNLDTPPTLSTGEIYTNIKLNYVKSSGKNICPLPWEELVDTYSWGICYCENGVTDEAAGGLCKTLQ
jgi:hypothetical protein